MDNSEPSRNPVYAAEPADVDTGSEVVGLETLESPSAGPPLKLDCFHPHLSHSVRVTAIMGGLARHHSKDLGLMAKLPWEFIPETSKMDPSELRCGVPQDGLPARFRCEDWIHPEADHFA